MSKFDADMSPAEIETLQARDAEQAVAQQEAAQAERDAEALAAEAEETGQPAEAAATQTQEEDPAQAEPEQVEATQEQQEPQAPAPYQVGDIAAMETQRKALRDQEAEVGDKIQAVRDQWNQGDLSDDEKDAQIQALRSQASTLRDQQDELLQEVSAQRALASANAQREAADQTKVLVQIAKGAAGVIDYANPAVANQFDAQLSALAADAEWAGKTFAERAAKAHELVCVLNGKAPAPVAAAPAAATTNAAPAAPAAKRDVPPTLGGIPAAGATPVGTDFISQFEGLDPDAAEAMLASLPPAARTNAFRATVRG